MHRSDANADADADTDADGYANVDEEGEAREGGNLGEDE